MKYLNLNQLSDKMGGRSRSSLYRDFENGTLPKPFKIGGRLYVVESDVEATISAAQSQAA